MAGIRTPITNHPLQAFVTEPVKPMLHKILVSANLHVYVSQTDRGEFLIGSEIEPYTTYDFAPRSRSRSTRPRTRSTWCRMLARLKILRQWTGYCDMTPDYSPIMGETEVENFYLDAGWGTWGFKATAVCGETMAEMAATRKTPELIAAVPPLALRGRDAGAGEGRGLRLALNPVDRRAPRAPAGLPSSAPWTSSASRRSPPAS